MVCAGIAQWEKSLLPAENNFHIYGRWSESRSESGCKGREGTVGCVSPGDTASSSACLGLGAPIQEAFAWSLSGGGCELSNLRFGEGSAGILFCVEAKDHMAWEDVEPLEWPKKSKTSFRVKSRAGKLIDLVG